MNQVQQLFTENVSKVGTEDICEVKKESHHLCCATCEPKFVNV